MAIDTPLHATGGFDSIRGMTVIAGLVQVAVPQLERYECAAGVQLLASGLEGGLGAVSTKIKKVHLSNKGGLRYCVDSCTTADGFNEGISWHSQSSMFCAWQKSGRESRKLVQRKDLKIPGRTERGQ